MKLMQLFLEKKGDTYDYSAVLCTIPPSIAKFLEAWGVENIPDEDVYTEEGGRSYGRENDFHVTVKYGLHDGKEDKVVDVLKHQKPFDIELGKISLFNTHEKYDVVKVEVFSDTLHVIHNKLGKLPNSDEYPEYKPHATIAYVKKGSCDKFNGLKDFQDIKFGVDSLIFSSNEGFKAKVNLR